MQKQGKRHNRSQAGLIRPYIFIQGGIEVFMENQKGTGEVVGWFWLRIRENVTTTWHGWICMLELDP